MLLNNVNQLKILIIGSGITGCSTSYNLNKLLKNNKLHGKIEIFEKGKILGGRMTTTYDKSLINNYFDLGFKNIKKGKSKENIYLPSSKLSYQNMCSENILKCHEININSEKLFYLTKGGTYLMDYLLNDTYTNTYFNKKVISINSTTINSRHVWQVDTNNNQNDFFDVIISTIPVPQLLEIEGNFLKHVNDKLLNKMKNVEYYNTFSLGLVYNSNIIKFPDKIDYLEKNNLNNEIIDFISIRKIPFNNSYHFSFNIQAKKEWSTNNFNLDKFMVKKIIKDNVQNILPFLKDINPFYDKMMRWKYSFIKNKSNISETVKNDALILKSKPYPLFILAGDSISGSNFENCIRSGFLSSQLIENQININIP